MAKPKISIVVNKNSNNVNKSESKNYFKYLDDFDNDNPRQDILDNKKVSDKVNNKVGSKDEENKQDNLLNRNQKRLYKNDRMMKNLSDEPEIVQQEELQDNNQENIVIEDDDKWLSVEKKKSRNLRSKPQKSNFSRSYTETDVKNDYFPDFDNVRNEDFDITEDGSEYKLENSWYIWTHKSESSNWTTDSYKHIFTIDSLKTFWEFFGNIDKLDVIKHQFYIMRSSSQPTWEHPSNRNGGICSIRVIKDRAIEIIEQMAILVLNECFSDIPSDINGLSFSVKHNWGVIKIWNKTGSNDISTQMPMYMLKKYSATPRYQPNTPEY